MKFVKKQKPALAWINPCKIKIGFSEKSNKLTREEIEILRNDLKKSFSDFREIDNGNSDA